MKLDDSIVARMLGDFAALIKNAAESPDKGRFTTIVALAKQAQHFQQLIGHRVNDFDEITYEGGLIQNAIIGQPGGLGDQAEMYRTLIDSLKEMANRRQSPAAELNELLDVRRGLKLDGEPIEDIDTRIKTLRKEIADGHTSTVVRTELLRGPETGTLGEGNAPLLGERHPDGAEDATDPLRSCGEEGLGEGHGARPDEGVPNPVD